MSTPNEHVTRRQFLNDAARVTAAVAASAGIGSAVPLIVRAGEAGAPRRSRISYYCNGEIHVNEPGRPESKPLTTGHTDFKPSWSKTGDMLVCFRRTKNDPVVTNWLSAIFIIHVDGSGFHQLSDGTRTDFNPTWTRDGLNTPIWNRKNDKKGGFFVMQSKVGNKPGQEVAITDESHLTWAHSCLADGRILVASYHTTLGPGYFLMTRKDGGKPVYERIECELAKKGLLDRVSVSPSEKKICFEYQRGFKSKGMAGRTLYIADFDVQKRTITNPRAFANEAGKPFWIAYPRWIDGEAAVVYHSGETGKNQLYVYRLEDGSTKRVSTNASADYRYPHGEAAPC
jgi:Tol biopolymer transport system component